MLDNELLSNVQNVIQPLMIEAWLHDGRFSGCLAAMNDRFRHHFC